MSDPSVFPMVATTTTIQKFHGCPVIGSIWLGSDTRKPAYGRISSDGSGIIADSIAIAIRTPRYPTAPYRPLRNGMTIWSMKASTGPRVADVPSILPIVTEPRGSAPDDPIVLTGADLTIGDVESVARGGRSARLDDAARRRMQESRDL